MPARPPPLPRFTDGTLFKLLPIALSLAALVVSVGALWWKDLSDRPRLVVTFADLALPVTEDRAADTPGQTRGVARAHLLLANGGNRATSLVGAEIELVVQPQPEPTLRFRGPDGRPLGSTVTPSVTKVTKEQACRAPPPGALRFPVESAALPAVVAAGAVVAVPATIELLYDWDRLHGSRRIESCIVFTFLDDRGAARTRRFPFASWTVGEAATFDTLPTPDKPKAPFGLL